MYRIRLHGRGGQGMKTASRILGTALFGCGYEVQDAPRYGAERRGAPVFAYVRASRKPIHERGVIHSPDLIVVADETLLSQEAAGVLAGVGPTTVLLLATRESPELWRERLGAQGPIVSLPLDGDDAASLGFAGGSCAAGAARLLGVVPHEALEAAMRDELGDLGEDIVRTNLAHAARVWEALESRVGCVIEGPDLPETRDLPSDAQWIDLPFDDASVSAPDIYAPATSVQVRTGLWRTVRPEIDMDQCRRCSWICATLCPDSCIEVDADRTPHIDLDHCKGCGICAAVCPPHAISLVLESAAVALEAETPKEEERS